MPFAAFLLSLISLLSLHGIALASKSPDSVRLIVTNFAGAPVMVSWAQPGSSVLVPQISTPLTNTSHTIINSFSTHEFVVNWASPSNAQDPQAAPRFAMGELSENVWVFSHKENGSLWIIQENALSAHDQNFDQALAECKYEISQEIAVDSDEELLISEINRCLKQKIRREFFSLEKKLKNERFLKESLSHKLREYVCRDPNVKTSESVSHGAWHSEDLRRNIKFHTLFDQRGVKIAAVDDFITEEECQILKKRSEGRMTKAAVVGDNGAAQLSVSRKAYAADVNVNRRSNGDVVDPLM